MSTTAGTPDASFRVSSRDGTAITVWFGGDGPPIVLVHGSFTDHTAWSATLPELRRHFSTYALDRRGFGASGDGEDYGIAREFDDLAEVVASVAERSESTVTVWGHSFGANCAMGGAALSSSVGHLILYEPSLGLRYPPGAIESAEEALARGDNEGVVQRMLFDILDMSDDDIAAMKGGPRWPLILDGARTVVREARVEHGWVYEPGQFETIAAPTLLISGDDSTDPVRAATERAFAAIPGSRIRVLEGHGHFAHRTHPGLVVDLVRDFVRST